MLGGGGREKRSMRAHRYKVRDQVKVRGEVKHTVSVMVRVFVVL